MEINPDYLVGDVVQTGLAILAITYFFGTAPPEDSLPKKPLELTEEFLWFIA